MDILRPIPAAWRATFVAVAASAVVHGAVLVGLRAPDGEEPDLEAPAYTATIEPAAVAEPAPVAAPAPPPKPRVRARPKRPAPIPGEALAFLPPGGETGATLPEASPAESIPDFAPLPDIVAMAEPAVPVAPAEPSPFPTDALPDEVSINYALTSVLADGEAEYTWKRDGDHYAITGMAQATGFFALFVEGSLYQSASGRVTPEGLQPERFTERRGDTPEEGLSFDWKARRVEFQRGDQRRTGPLTDSTVDWLSMIFQLAHVPPKGDEMDLRVFTQRRLYQYRLQVLGTEDLELPFGNAKTLHLRHTGDKPEETVDVWLGVGQHYLPVKLRYPVARNRLVIEQTATSVTAR